MGIETTLSADWIIPVASSPIANGIVSFADGSLTYVGPYDGRDIEEVFDNAVLLPGLVNAHTHLDLTGASGLTPPKLPFTEWLRSVIEYRRTHPDVTADIERGAELCLASGTTLIGDIAGVTAAIQPIKSPLRRVTFFELIGMSPERSSQAIGAWNAAGPIPAGPHAPYSFNNDGLSEVARCCELISIHLAESVEEQVLLERRQGEFVSFLQDLEAWYPEGLAESCKEVFDRIGNTSSLIVHGNYLHPNGPFPENATLVYCPRTHAAFGHPPHPFRDFLNRGVRVVLGTDSLASNPDLSVLNEARFIAQNYSDLDEATLLHMITDWSAQALQKAACGCLTPGNNADLCVVQGKKTDDPLRALFRSDTPVLATYIGGVRVV